MTRTPVAWRLARPAGIVAAVVLAGLVVLAPSGPAAAHNQLIEADPAPEARLTTAPEVVELVFAEPLDPEFTTVVVNDAAQSPLALGEPEIEGGRVTVSLPSRLADGEYTVAYRVVSADGHPVQGSYSFTVTAGGAAPTRSAEPAAAEPSATASPSAAPTEPPATAAPSEAAEGPAVVDAGFRGFGGAAVAAAAGVAGVIGLVAAGAYLWRRRRAA